MLSIYLVCERQKSSWKPQGVTWLGTFDLCLYLAKTALWCAAQDERFAAAISNNSGYGGAASSKHGEGERVADFIRVGSWDWFCENFKEFTGELEDKKPYDQSFLLGHVITACAVRCSVPEQPPDQCVHSPLISACQSLITA